MIKKVEQCFEFSNHVLAHKINELVDAVNELTSCVGQLGVEFTDPKANTVYVDKECYMSDLYTEKRKWIGKICKVRDNCEERWRYALLKRINPNSDFPFVDDDDYEWAICEPIKPDDNVIYKKD